MTFYISEEMKCCLLNVKGQNEFAILTTQSNLRKVTMQLKQKMIRESPISGDVLKVKGRNNTEKYCQMWPCEK